MPAIGITHPGVAPSGAWPSFPELAGTQQADCDKRSHLPSSGSAVGTAFPTRQERCRGQVIFQMLKPFLRRVTEVSQSLIPFNFQVRSKVVAKPNQLIPVL